MMARDALLHLVDRAERGRLLLAEASLLRSGIVALTDERPPQPAGRAFPLPFVFHRPTDPTVEAETGDFAEGVVFTDGTVALRWRGAHPFTGAWASLAAALHTYGAEGLTSVQWPPDDAELAARLVDVETERDRLARTVNDLHDGINAAAREAFDERKRHRAELLDAEAALARLEELLREARAGAAVADELYRGWMGRAEDAEAALAPALVAVVELRDTARTLRATLDRVPAEHRPHCPHGYVAHRDSCPVCDRDTDRRRALLAEPAHELAERLGTAAQLASALCDHLPSDARSLAHAIHRLCAGEITPQQALDETTE
jgi:hypothetical protein